MTSIPRGASRIRIGTSRLSKSNANTFVHARAHGLFLPCVSGLTSGTPLGACGTLGVSPRLIPPHSVEYPHTSLASLKYCYTASARQLSLPMSLRVVGKCTCAQSQRLWARPSVRSLAIEPNRITLSMQITSLQLLSPLFSTLFGRVSDHCPYRGKSVYVHSLELKH